MGLTFLLGGARSGKSSLAVRLASASGGSVTVIATAEPRDDEMAARIRAHRAARPATWPTIEEPIDLAGALTRVRDGDTLLLDCLSLWVSNAFEASVPPAEIVERACSVADGVAARPGPTIAVSNEVGLGIVPMHPLGRAYRDALGAVNAAWVERAERSFLVVAGRTLPLLDALGSSPHR